MKTRLGMLTLAAMAMAMGGMEGFAPMEPEANTDLEICVKIWPEVAYIKAKKSKLSASERRAMLQQWDRAYARLSPRQREQLFTTMNQHIDQENAS